MGGKKKYIKMFGSFSEAFNSSLGSQPNLDLEPIEWELKVMDFCAI